MTSAKQRLAAGPAWPDTGLFFVRPDGRAWRPSGVSQRFNRLVARSGLPPVRFHDLRHIAATLAHEGGADVKTVQDQMGHTTPTMTRNYQGVLRELHDTAAEAVADVIRKHRTA